MATRKPWIHNNNSNSSLRGMEIAVPPGLSYPGQTLPPPAAVGIYGTKPLPPVPQRRSAAASFTSEVNKALQTPKRSVDYQENEFDWEKKEADVAVIIEKSVYGGQPAPKFDAARIPETPPDALLSPQPKQAVKKILRLTSGVKSPRTSLSPTSPSGHNSSHKIRQMMGLDVAMRDMYTVQEVSPVSPMSGSSVYSEDLAATISEPDADCYTGYYSDPEIQLDDSRSSRWTSWVPESPTGVPASLRISKINPRHSDPVVSPLTPTRPHSGQLTATRQHKRESSKGTQLYHETASQIARDSLTSSTSQDQIARPPSQDSSIYSTTGIPTFDTPGSSRKASFSDRPATSRVRMAPPPELRTSITSKPGSDFGSGYHPLKTPYPAKSAFEVDEKRRSISLPRVFRRSEVVEITSPSALTASSEKKSKGRQEGRAKVPETVIISNGSRKAEGPDTPLPFRSQLKELMAQAKNRVLVGGSGEDERKKVLKGKIRRVSEHRIGENPSPGKDKEASWL